MSVVFYNSQRDMSKAISLACATMPIPGLDPTMAGLNIFAGALALPEMVVDDRFAKTPGHVFVLEDEEAIAAWRRLRAQETKCAG